MDDTLKAALAAADAFEDLGIRWFLGGSLASSVHGVPRATFDADIVADVRLSHVKSLIKRLGDGWYVDEQAARDAIAGRSSFNLIHFDTALKVDVFVPKLRRFDGAEFARSAPTVVSEATGRMARVCAAEDIVVAKLEWFRLGGEDSKRQWEDVQGVLRIAGNRLDAPLMRESAEELGVLDLLECALAEASGS